MNSILMKFMRSFTVVIFATFVFFATLLLTFINSYSLEDNLRILKTGTEKIAEMTTKIKESGSYSVLQLSDYYALLRFYGESLNITVIITDKDGLIANVGFGKLKFIDGTVPSEVIVETIEKGSYSQTSRMNGFFGKMQHIYAKPYFDANGNAAGVVLLSSSAEFMSSIVSDMLSVFAAALVIALVVSYVSTYFITRRMTNPLKEMSKAAMSISQGNFKQRITVSGNDEVATLAGSFNNMADSLARLDEMKSSFISNVSHELKTPMTTISGFIDGITDKTIPPEKYDYYLNIISDEVKRLSRLVNTLTDIARIDSGGLHFTMVKFDYSELLLNVSAQFEMKFNDKSIHYNIDIPSKRMTVCADYDAIYRVVYNLLDNAVKFTDDGGEIVLSAKPKSDKIITSVRNTGSGISSSDLPFVFDKFYKADRSRSEDKKSFGLGLFLCRYIINGHGENIYVRSEEGKFAEFIFTLSQKSDKGDNNDR